MQNSVLYTLQWLRSKHQDFPTYQDLGTNACSLNSPYHEVASQSMATFSSLPTELLHQVSSYLAPFDQVALSATSKSFHAIIRPCIRLDQISQHIYLSLNSKTANSSASNYLINHHTEVQTRLKKTYHGTLPSPEYSHYHGRFILSPPVPSLERKLLQPYFPDKGFPQCTIAHHYFSTINRFAELIQESELSNDFGEVLGWAYVKMYSLKFLQRLEETLAKTETVEDPALDWDT